MFYHYDELAVYLRSKGADDTIQNNYGYTCYDGLRPDNKDEAIMLLKKTMTKRNAEAAYAHDY